MRFWQPFIIVAITVLVLAQSALAAGDIEFGRYHALVIGNNEYANLPTLGTAVNDAEAVAAVLRSRYGFQVKLLLNVFDTKAENGPFTLIPADASLPIRRRGEFRRRFSDAQVDAECGLENAVQLVGGAGSGAFVDTCRCLHFGSRETRADRLVLMIQFTRFHCPTESTFDFAVPPDLAGLDADPMKRLALGLEPRRGSG